MSIQVNMIDESEVKSGGFGEKTWNHQAIIDFLKRQYQALIENSDDLEYGDTVKWVTFKESEAYKEWVDNDMTYNEWVNEKNHPHPTFVSQIEDRMEDAGFLTESTDEKRKSPIGYMRNDDGEYVIKVELTPTVEEEEED